MLSWLFQTKFSNEFLKRLSLVTYVCNIRIELKNVCRMYLYFYSFPFHPVILTIKMAFKIITKRTGIHVVRYQYNNTNPHL